MKAAAAVLFGWLVPGGAYLLKRRYLQFALAFVPVCAAFSAGIALGGANQWPQTAELRGLDGFAVLTAKAGALTKILAGGPWLLVRFSGHSQTFLNAQVHEYGTVLLLAAGLINLLALTEAK